MLYFLNLYSVNISPVTNNPLHSIKIYLTAADKAVRRHLTRERLCEFFSLHSCHVAAILVLRHISCWLDGLMMRLSHASLAVYK